MAYPLLCTTIPELTREEGVRAARTDQHAANQGIDELAADAGSRTFEKALCGCLARTRSGSLRSA
jgi:hypothetical protein